MRGGHEHRSYVACYWGSNGTEFLQTTIHRSEKTEQQPSIFIVRHAHPHSFCRRGHFMVMMVMMLLFLMMMVGGNKLKHEC